MPEKSTEHKLATFWKKNRIFIFLSAFLLFLFYAFSFLLVKGGKLNGFDFNMTVRIQDRIPIRIDPYFSFLSIIGSFEATLIILIAILLIFRRKITSIFVVLIFCLMHAVEIAGKAFLDHPPTPFMFHRYAFDFFFPSGYVQPGGSYPSGHAMRTTFLAVIIIDIILKSKVKPTVRYVLMGAVVAFCLLMYISRISLGEHWTTDIIGGALLGAAFAFLSLIFI